MPFRYSEEELERIRQGKSPEGWFLLIAAGIAVLIFVVSVYWDTT